MIEINPNQTHDEWLKSFLTRVYERANRNKIAIIQDEIFKNPNSVDGEIKTYCDICKRNIKY